MAEDSWSKLEREMFLKNYTPKPAMTDNMRRFAKTLLEKYNAHMIKALCGDSIYVAQNWKESIEKSQEAEPNGDE